MECLQGTFNQDLVLNLNLEDTSPKEAFFPLFGFGSESESPPFNLFRPRFDQFTARVEVTLV